MENINKILSFNRFFEKYRISEILRMDSSLRSICVIPIFFKGSLFAKLLYEENYTLQEVDDIDVWINESSFNIALDVFY